MNWMTDPTYFPLLLVVIGVPILIWLAVRNDVVSSTFSRYYYRKDSRLNPLEAGFTICVTLLILSVVVMPLFQTLKLSDRQLVSGYVTSKYGIPLQPHSCNCRTVCDRYSTDEDGDRTCSSSHEECDTCYLFGIRTSIGFGGHDNIVYRDDTNSVPPSDWQAVTVGQPCSVLDVYENVLSKSGDSILGHPKSPLTESLVQAGYIPPRPETLPINKIAYYTAMYVGDLANMPPLGRTVSVADKTVALVDWAPYTLAGNAITGPGAENAKKTLTNLNISSDIFGILSLPTIPITGSQATVNFILTDFRDDRYPVAVMDAWRGGAKNGVVAFLGVDKQGIIRWASMLYGIPGVNITEERKGDNARLAVEFQSFALDRLKVVTNPVEVVKGTTLLVLDWFNRVPNKQFEAMKADIHLDLWQIWAVYILTILFEIAVLGVLWKADLAGLD